MSCAERHAAEHDPPAEAIDGDGAGIEVVLDAVGDGRRRLGTSSGSMVTDSATDYAV